MSALEHGRLVVAGGGGGGAGWSGGSGSPVTGSTTRLPQGKPVAGSILVAVLMVPFSAVFDFVTDEQLVASRAMRKSAMSFIRLTDDYKTNGLLIRLLRPAS